MTDQPRGRPYIWATWLTALLAGTDKCQWRAWYKSHYKYAKRPDEGDGESLKQWIKNHDAMTEKRVHTLRQEGWDQIRVEDDNAFKLEGKNATMSGKPDIVAMKSQKKHIKIIDEKSGKERASDVWQVLLYMFSLPLVWAKEWTIEGEVEYKNNKYLPVTNAMLDQKAKDNIIGLLGIVGGSVAPARVPSANECRFCDVLNCPDRYQTPVSQIGDARKLF